MPCGGTRPRQVDVIQEVTGLDCIRRSATAFELLLSMLLTVGLSGFLRMVSSVIGVSSCGVGVVRGLLVLSALVMLCGFAMVASGLAQML